jgi:hypothetical protein
MSVTVAFRAALLLRAARMTTVQVEAPTASYNPFSRASEEARLRVLDGDGGSLYSPRWAGALRAPGNRQGGLGGPLGVETTPEVVVAMG